MNIGGPDARVENDGTIGAYGGTATITTPLTGTGTIVSSVNRMLGGRVEFKSAVGAGQAVQLDQGSVQIDAPREFLGTLSTHVWSVPLHSKD